MTCVPCEAAELSKNDDGMMNEELDEHLVVVEKVTFLILMLEEIPEPVIVRVAEDEEATSATGPNEESEGT